MSFDNKCRMEVILLIVKIKTLDEIINNLEKAIVEYKYKRDEESLLFINGVSIMVSLKIVEQRDGIDKLRQMIEETHFTTSLFNINTN